MAHSIFIKSVNKAILKGFFKINPGLLFFAGVFFISCNINPANKKEYRPAYHFDSTEKKAAMLVGVYPGSNPQYLHSMYGPIIDYLNKNIPEAKFQFVASSSYHEFESRLYTGYFHFSLANPYEVLEAIKHGNSVYAKMSDDEKFKGVILIRKDNSTVKTFSDLKGKIVSFPAPTAFAATIMPLYYMQTHGLDVNRDIKRVYAGSQESSIMNAYLGKSIAASTWLQSWENFQKKNPEFASKLCIRWETPSLINNACMYRNDVDKKIVEKVASLLVTLHNTPEGRKFLDVIPLSKFERATNATYDPVVAFMEKYNSLNINQ